MGRSLTVCILLQSFADNKTRNLYLLSDREGTSI